MRECCGQGQAKVISKSSNKIHQTVGRLLAEPCSYGAKLAFDTVLVKKMRCKRQFCFSSFSGPKWRKASQPTEVHKKEKQANCK